MPNYRRWYVPGGTYFLTVVAEQRRQVFTDERIVDLLRRALREVCSERPFEIVAAVVLPDHLHFLWTYRPTTPTTQNGSAA